MLCYLSLAGAVVGDLLGFVVRIKVRSVVAVEVLLGPDLVAVPASSAAAGEDHIQNVAAVLNMGHELSLISDISSGVRSHTIGRVIGVLEGRISRADTNFNFC